MCRAEDARASIDHITRDVRPDDAEAFALLDEGQTYMDLPDASAALPQRHLHRQVQAPRLERGEPQHHRAHRQGRLLVHPPAAAPDALRPGGGAGPDVPGLVSLRRPADTAAAADRQRRAAAPRRGGRPAAVASRSRQHATRRRSDDRRRVPRASCSSGTPSTAATTPGGRAQPSPGSCSWPNCAWRGPAPISCPSIYEQLAAHRAQPRSAASHPDPGAEPESARAWARAPRLLVAVARALVEASAARCPSTSSTCARFPASATTSPRPCCASRSAGERCFSTHAPPGSSSGTSAGRTTAGGSVGSTSTSSRAPGPDAAFNHALLDHGALVCRAETPRCGECPLASTLRRRAAASPMPPADRCRRRRSADAA